MKPWITGVSMLCAVQGCRAVGYPSAFSVCLMGGSPVPALVVAGWSLPIHECYSDDDLTSWWCAEARAWLVRHDHPVTDGGADALAAALVHVLGGGL